MTSNSDYLALTTAAGFVELDGWSCLEVTGADRAMFLHNMCTNDVLRLAPGQGCEAFFTDVKAHILAHALIRCREASLVVTRSAPQISDLVAHLDRYIIREDVLLFDRTNEVRYLFVAGTSAGDKLGEATREPGLPERLLLPLSRAPVEIGGVSCALVRFPASTPPAWIIECPRIAASQVREQLMSRGVAPCDHTTWETVRIEMGFPLDRVDVTDQNLPQEIDRNAQAICFTKGCYLGQETVARIDALGHVNQTLVAVKFTGDRVPPREMPLLADGKQAGRVTSACFSPRENAPLALAFVRRGHNVPGTKLQTAEGDAEVRSAQPNVTP